MLPLAVEGEGAFAASGSCITVRGDSNAWFATGGKAARVFASTGPGTDLDRGGNPDCPWRGLFGKFFNLFQGWRSRNNFWRRL